MNSTGRAGDVSLSSSGVTCEWWISVTLPECSHPEEHQIVSADGTECDLCGYKQARHDPAETEGVDA